MKTIKQMSLERPNIHGGFLYVKCLRTGKHNKCLGCGLIVFGGIHNQEVPEDKVFLNKGEERGSKAEFSSWRFVAWLLGANVHLLRNTAILENSSLLQI